MWKSHWESLPPERKEQLQYLLTSAATGPKGRDALVFALVKAPASAAQSAAPSGADAKTDSRDP